MTVYRVQDRDGRGPWRTGFSHLWVEGRADLENLLPWFIEFPRPLLRVGMFYGSACRTREQLRRWFTESEYASLVDLGYEAVALHADRILAESAIQCLFERAMPLNHECAPIRLYGLVTFAKAAEEAQDGS